MPNLTVRGHMLGPQLPRVIGERILAVGREEFCELPPLLVRKACADTDMLQRAGTVEEPEQQRPNIRVLAFFVPSKPGDEAVTIALVFYLEHHALVRLVGPRKGFGHDTVETS